jgi:CHAT domain-containing protein
VASLADEFFRRGVADYVGTAWAVPDALARQFAQEFYDTLLPPTPPRRGPLVTGMIGRAMQEARKALYAQRATLGEHGSVWGAWQHYGDPTRGLSD